MTPKPLGFYGLNLPVTTQAAIDCLPLPALTDLMDDFVSDLNMTHYLGEDTIDSIEEQPIKPSDLSDLKKLGLIRALCDRIEVKLMEEAK